MNETDERLAILDWVRQYTNNPDLEDTGGVHLAIDRIKKHIDNDPTVSSKSIARYSKANISADATAIDIETILKPYKIPKRAVFL